jgi:cytochrome b
MRSPQRIWDLPVRLTHWLLAGLIVFSWWTAETHRLDLHIWSGCGILALLIFRLLWGLFGSSTARFSNLVRGPRAVRDYLRGTWRGLGLFAQDDDGIYTGPLYRLVSSDTSDAIRRIHESWFNVVWVLAALHIAAILFYRVVRGKKLTGAMISGKGDVEAGIAPMRPGKWWVALLCLIVAIGITRWVIAGAPPFGP